ncbi:MAG: TraR/DksA C4-type zinc finger protein [Desulfobacteria bacterium]
MKCSLCCENIMETRARVVDGKPICIPCAHDEHYAMKGDGIYIER